MTFKRAAGILLHPTSLPGPFGIGDLGPSALRFIEWLAASGCGLWQILPLGPTGFADSPYQCFSAFAGNPYLISPQELIADGLLVDEDLEHAPNFDSLSDGNDSRVDFGTVIPWKLDLLQRAFARFESAPEELRQAYDYFYAENASWLEDFALFMSLKELHGGGSWRDWPEPLRARKKSALTRAKKSLTQSMRRQTFYQFIFFRQWEKVRKNANEHGVQIIGDIPIFVAYDSADVWAHQELFYLDEARTPTVVAGVPPDGFSATGQLWGNPLYNWSVHQAAEYSWWMARMRASLKSVDILRVDHFRGFAAYYEIPAAHATAERGRWVPGPGADFFQVVDRLIGDGLSTPSTGLPIVAEDLGVVTPDVIELLERFGLPGMRVLQFGFHTPQDPFLPHNFVPNCVAYTGTHDNDTAVGWFAKATEAERDFARRYLDCDGTDFAWDLIRAVWKSVAVFAIAPMQDVLALDGRARMNFPSTVGGNWQWRMRESELTDDLAAKLRELTWLSNR